MLSFIDRGAGPTALVVCIVTVALSLATRDASSDALTLEAAQQLAVERDAGRAALAGESEALRAMSVAAGALPDPEARLGAVNLPTDSFALDAEPMTMLEVGVMQRFPAGASRDLSRQALERRAEASEADEAERGRAIRIAVARAWHELDYLDELAGLLDRERDWVGTLVAGVRGQYAAGAGRQAGLLDARLMALEVEERFIDLERERDVARAELSRWIGESAHGDRVPAGSAKRTPPPLPQLLERLEAHPRLLALDKARESAQLEVELAGERYKPAFGLDVSYGFRQGRMADGAGIPDMLTAMVTFDLPLFTRNRQDREASAARARARASDARRVDALRELASQLEAAHARATRLGSLIELYESEVRGFADVSAESALSSYRASDGDLEDVVMAERRAIDVRERLARLHKDYAIALAEIDYLSGDQP